MEYKIGQILTAKEEITLEGFFGDKKVVPKGSKIIIGGDKLAHHLRGGYIQSLQEDAEVKGYDSAGLAKYIFTCLDNKFNLKEIFEDSYFDADDFREEIEWALDEIGL